MFINFKTHINELFHNIVKKKTQKKQKQKTKNSRVQIGCYPRFTRFVHFSSKKKYQYYKYLCFQISCHHKSAVSSDIII